MTPMKKFTKPFEWPTKWLLLASAIGSAVLAIGLAFISRFLVTSDAYLNRLSFGFTVASVILAVFIFSWTARATARRLAGEVDSEHLWMLASQDLKSADPPSYSEWQAISIARAKGESVEALKAIFVGSWKRPGPGRGARVVILDGPDIWFVNSTNSRYGSEGGYVATKMPNGGSWDRRPSP